MNRRVCEHLGLYLHISHEDAEKHTKKLVKYGNFYFIDASDNFPYKEEQNKQTYPSILKRVKTAKPITIKNKKKKNKNQKCEKIRPAIRKYEEIRGSFIWHK